jgi:tetratricopeptide (TPR) repeat protein
MTRLNALVAAAAALAVVAAVNTVSRQHGSSLSSAPAGALSPSVPVAPSLAALPSAADGSSLPTLSPAPDDPRVRAIAALSRRLALHPRDAAARFRLAELYFKGQEYERALAELATLERQNPRKPEVFLRQAVVLKYAGQPERAAKAARRALALEPDHALAREWLAAITLDQGRAHEALALFEECLKRQPHSLFALLGKARALEELLRSRHPIPISRVIAPVEEALRQSPDHPEALATLARMRFAYQNRTDEAERLARRAATQDPDSASPHLLLAQIALTRPPTAENLQRAGEHAFAAGSRDPDDPRPPYVIGRVALQQNDVPRAIRALEFSLAREPTPEAVSQLAVAHRRAGNAQRADHYAALYQRYTDLLGRRNALLAARERDPQEIDHTYALVALYIEASQPETAAEWLAEARRLRPHDPRASWLAARISTLRREDRDAPLLPIP